MKYKVSSSWASNLSCPITSTILKIAAPISLLLTIIWISVGISDSFNSYKLSYFFEISIPSDLIDRPKSGFAIPVGKWIKNDLKEWTFDLLSDDSLGMHNLFNNQGKKIRSNLWSFRDREIITNKINISNKYEKDRKRNYEFIIY